MKAFELLDSEEKWCQNVMCIPMDMNYMSSQVEKRCMLAAVLFCYNERPTTDLDYVKSMEYRLRDAVINTTGMGPSKFNDTHTFKEVRDLLIKLDI